MCEPQPETRSRSGRTARARHYLLHFFSSDSDVALSTVLMTPWRRVLRFFTPIHTLYGSENGTGSNTIASATHTTAVGWSDVQAVIILWYRALPFPSNFTEVDQASRYSPIHSSIAESLYVEGRRHMMRQG